ncbi:CPBP family intramembrane glutamic endopeptidase [Ornithinibacillus bavariensis]|uniref:CPBP family intramembrane glutamic endopeptidase n=1 Tax=Ornithinibacillus bavariensis TaxID=545502 RepID=UPI003D22E9BF
MFWYLLLLTVAICLPGIYFMFQTEKKMPNNDEISDKERLVAHFAIVVLFGAIGAFAVPKVDIIPLEFNVYSILKYGLIFGVICSVGNLVLYYFYLLKSITTKDYLEIEKHYHNIGILSRILYAGFVEEIMFRWGIMSFILWLLQFAFKPLTITAVVIAIGISSILFSLVHLPSIKMVSTEPKSAMYVYTILGNIWVGVFAGWAFLEAGIFAAIIVHILFHLLWYPIQKMEQKKHQLVA